MHPFFTALLILPMLMSGIFIPLHAQEQAAQPQNPHDVPVNELHTEDWTSIELASSRLRLNATAGVPLSRVEMTGCTRELIRVQWRINDPIDIYVIRPTGTGPLPVVLFLYNYTYDTDIFRAERWCDQAKENGFAVAGFPSALSLPRIRAPRPLKQWFVSQLQEALASTTHDVQMALNYLATRGDLDMNRVGVFGQGSGGAIAILAAVADPRIKALDVMDPWGDWPAWLRDSKQIPELERAAYLEPRFLDSVKNLDPLTYLPRLTGRALRIQQTTDDPATPAQARASLAAAAPRVEQVERFATLSDEAKALGGNGILGWFHEQLMK